MLAPGYRVKILDGNDLRRTQRRLGVLRELNVAPLPGQALAVLDPSRKLIIDVFPCEDAHAQERSLLPAVLETVARRDVWIADRNVCTTGFLSGIAERDAAFVIRQHGNALHVQHVGRRLSRGRCDTGALYEQTMTIDAADGRSLQIRRINVRCDADTRDGDRELRILTNLPARFSAGAVAELAEKRPQHVGQEADQEVGQHAVLLLVPHGPQRQVALSNAERRFRVGQSRVRPPQLFVAPVANVGPQRVGSFAQLRPRAPAFDLRPFDRCRAWFIAAHADVEQPRRARVLSEQAADAAAQPPTPPPMMATSPDHSAPIAACEREASVGSDSPLATAVRWNSRRRIRGLGRWGRLVAPVYE